MFTYIYEDIASYSLLTHHFRYTPRTRSLSGGWRSYWSWSRVDQSVTTQVSAGEKRKKAKATTALAGSLWKKIATTYAILILVYSILLRQISRECEHPYKVCTFLPKL